MQVNKIQSNKIQHNKTKRSKPSSKKQVINSYVCQPREFADLNSANITFQGDLPPIYYSYPHSYADFENAAQSGHLNILKREIDAGANINNIGYYGVTALHRACHAHKTNIAQYLLGLDDIDINIQDWDGRTPLHMALDSFSDDIMLLLLERDDINLTLKNKRGLTVLDIAKSWKCSYKPWYEELKEKTEYQLEHPETIGKGFQNKKAKNTKPPVDIDKLSPEDNIWTNDEISNEFLNLVKDGKYNKAKQMLKSTPLIDLESDSRIMLHVRQASDSNFIEQVYDYKLNKQPLMLVDYETKRKEFLDKTIRTLNYDELKTNNIALSTIDGFRVLMEKPEFNPNDTFNDKNTTLFERACNIDPKGNLAKEILSTYGDVFTVKAAKIENKVIKDLIENYEKVGKYKIILNKIVDNAFYEKKRSIAATQLHDLLQSVEFTPEIVDDVGNTVLHIAAALPDDSARMLIQSALDKGVNIDAANCVGQRPLMSAIKKLITTEDNAGKMNLMANIKFLLDKGADINAQDNFGQTAFHFACISTIGALLTLLLSKKPNVFLEDKAGNRASKYLKTDEMKEIYQKYLMG